MASIPSIVTSADVQYFCWTCMRVEPANCCLAHCANKHEQAVVERKLRYSRKQLLSRKRKPK